MSDPSVIADLRGPVLRYLTHMLKDASEAEDVVQEVWIRALNGLDSLRDDTARAAWLYQIATRAALDLLRSRKRRVPVELDVELSEMSLEDENLPSLVAALERREMSGCIQRFVQELPDDYRSVLFLTEFEGMSGSEVAATLGISLGAAKIRLHRARQQLRAALSSGCCLSQDERGVLVCQPK